MAHQTEPDPELIQRIRWYISLRWFLLLTILLPGLTALYLGSGYTPYLTSSAILGAVALATNLIFYILAHVRRNRSYLSRLGISLLIFDTLFITYFIYANGGIESRSQLLYALPILISAALFGRLAVYLTAACSALTYDMVIAGNYWGFLHSPQMVTHQASDFSYVINTIVFFTAILLIVGTLADFITRLLIRKEQESSVAVKALRRAQRIAHIGSWEWNLASDTITWSEELFNIFAVPQHSSKADFGTYLKLTHPEDRKMVSDIIAKAVAAKKSFSFDHRVTWPDQSVHIVHSEGQVSKDKEGKVMQLHGTAQDVTENRALETAKGDFVSLASHQLRTPASAVRMTLALLRDGYIGELKPEQQDEVKKAYDANERMLKIADDLLNVAKLESGRLTLHEQEVELGGWLRNLVISQKPHMEERRQKLVVLIPKLQAYLKIDPSRMAMVVDNLLSNARKYTPVGGTITVSLKRGRAAHSIIVSDTGYGMTRQECSQLFGKFSRLSNQASRDVEGTGLGLFLVKSIVDLHKGTVKVSSKPGVGTTFTVRLPVNKT